MIVSDQSWASTAVKDQEGEFEGEDLQLQRNNRLFAVCIMAGLCVAFGMAAALSLL